MIHIFFAAFLVTAFGISGYAFAQNPQAPSGTNASGNGGNGQGRHRQADASGSAQPGGQGNSGAASRGGNAPGGGNGFRRGGRQGAQNSDQTPVTLPAGPPKPIPPIANEQFFLVASLDPSRSQVLLKRPTEVTQLVKLNDKTQYIDENGQSLRITDFRAGDTVWVALSGSDPNSTAIRVRKGAMTVAELHQHYLDYPEIK